MIQFGVIWIDVNQVGILVIPNYRIFALTLVNFKIISALSIFKNIGAAHEYPILDTHVQVKAACASLKRSLATLRFVIAAVVLSRGPQRR